MLFVAYSCSFCFVFAIRSWSCGLCLLDQFVLENQQETLLFLSVLVRPTYEAWSLRNSRGAVSAQLIVSTACLNSRLIDLIFLRSELLYSFGLEHPALTLHFDLEHGSQELNGAEYLYG